MFRRFAALVSVSLAISFVARAQAQQLPPSKPAVLWPDLLGHNAAKDAATPVARLRARLTRAAIQSPEPRFKLCHREGEALSVAFSPDGQTLATGGPEGVVRLWNTGDGKETRLLRQFPSPPPRVPRSEY